MIVFDNFFGIVEKEVLTKAKDIVRNEYEKRPEIIPYIDAGRVKRKVILNNSIIVSFDDKQNCVNECRSGEFAFNHEVYKKIKINDFIIIVSEDEKIDIPPVIKEIINI